MLTHAAVLLFGRQPQRFLITSEVKCAHFHGTEVAKPIPSYQVYKGTVFAMVDSAVDFVLSKINLSVGTREESTQAPVAYEIPQEVVREAIVNAVAHRDYTSNASVQVMLFTDRLEIWNPGTLPPSLTLESLRHPHSSHPHNPLLAEALYLTRYIERMDTGTSDMIRRCLKAGLPEPEFRQDGSFVLIIRRPNVQATPPVTVPVTAPVDDYVERLLILLSKGTPLGNEAIREAFGLKVRHHLRETYINPALAAELIEMTIPDKPNSRLQKYRLTEKGRRVLQARSA